MSEHTHTPGPWELDNDEREGMEWNIHVVQTNHDMRICFMTSDGPARENAELIALAPTAPHTCSDPTCPGNINRQKLELWGELVEAIYNLLDARGYRAEDEARQLAKDVVTRAAAIPAPTQGDKQ